MHVKKAFFGLFFLLARFAVRPPSSLSLVVEWMGIGTTCGGAGRAHGWQMDQDNNVVMCVRIPLKYPNFVLWLFFKIT